MIVIEPLTNCNYYQNPDKTRFRCRIKKLKISLKSEGNGELSEHINVVFK